MYLAYMSKVKQLYRCVRLVFVYGCAAPKQLPMLVDLVDFLHFLLLFFAAECVYLDRENIFLEPNVVDIVGMLEIDLSEVASVTTVIWF